MRKKILNQTLWSLFILAIVVSCAVKFGYLPLSIAYGPEKAASSLYVNGAGFTDVKVGGGVLLGDVSEGVTNIYFLTARHTVTHNRNFLDKLRIYYRQGLICQRIILKNTLERWMTLKDSSKPDCAWIKLDKDELPNNLSGLSFIPISNVVANASYMVNGETEILMLDSLSKYYGRFIHYDTFKVPNKEGFLLREESYYVGVINKFTPITFSGSPVFARVEGDSSVRLIGTTAISNEGLNQTGFVPISRIVHNITKETNMDGSVLLIDCREIW